ncbi:hypothetical protein AH156_19920 [Salmonella enterica subsp. enterica serovar Enteritidis]|nr:hypothetical protein [Salmonella enterica subsp. enterica serovar Enteritidis]
MKFFDIFKSKARKATDAADLRAAYFHRKGLTPINLGTSFHQEMAEGFRNFAGVDLTAAQLISFCIAQTIKDKGIEIRPGKYSVTVDITNVRDQLHFKENDGFDSAVFATSEFLAISPRIIEALKITQHPMPGRINIECYSGDDFIYTVMLCSEFEG